MRKKSEHEAIAEFVMPRKRKVPSRYDSNGNEYSHSNPKLFYRQHYFDVVDYVAGNIKERFDQPNYLIYIKLQNIILKASCCQGIQVRIKFIRRFIQRRIQFFFIKVSAGITSKIRRIET